MKFGLFSIPALIMAIIALGLSYSSPSAKTPPPMTFAHSPIQLVGPEAQIIDLDAELAETSAEQERGLMYRKSVPSGTGMLFVFSQPRTVDFWMKDTLIPLDIIFFDAEGKYVSATSMTPCKQDPCPMYPSHGIAASALEVQEGFIQKNGIDVGWKLVGK